MCAPGLTHSPKSIGWLAPVADTITSAPITASFTEEQTVTGSWRSLTNRWAISFLLLHTRTWSEYNTGLHAHKNSFEWLWRISYFYTGYLFELEELCKDIIVASSLLPWTKDAQHLWKSWLEQLEREKHTQIKWLYILHHYKFGVCFRGTYFSWYGWYCCGSFGCDGLPVHDLTLQIKLHN